MKFAWKKEYSVNIKAIDEQHKKFFDMVNRTQEMVKQGNTSSEQLLDILSQLNKYALYHLDYEEKMLTDNKYPELAVHKTFHQLYREEIKILMKRAVEEVDSNDYTDLVLEISEFCKSWLHQHLRTADKMYSEYIISKGIE